MNDPLVCVDVITVSRLLSALMSARLADLGVSLGQLPTLLALYQRDGQTQAELARATGVEQPTMAVNLRRMERDGLVQRRPDPADGRRALVQLTERAQAIRATVQGQRAELDAVSLDGVRDRDVATLRRVLRQMTDNLDAAAKNPEPIAAQRVRTPGGSRRGGRS